MTLAFKMGHVTISTPLSGLVTHSRLGFTMNNLSSKFEALSPPVTKIWKVMQNAVNWGLRMFWCSYGSLNVTGNNLIQYIAYKFLWALYSSYVPIVHHFWDIAPNWLKIDDFKLPYLYLAPIWVTSIEFHHDLQQQKTIVSALLCSLVYIIPLSASLVQYWLVMDRQTDRFSPGHSIYRASIASRSKNCYFCHTAYTLRKQLQSSVNEIMHSHPIVHCIIFNQFKVMRYMLLQYITLWFPRGTFGR